MKDFDALSVKEQRNEILKAIHNCLSEISAYLEYAVRGYFYVPSNFAEDNILLIKHCVWSKQQQGEHE